jgi:hypothetical protein
MLVVQDTLVSEDILERRFVCDLNACKGACCIEGDAGAPLEDNETAILDDIYEDIKPFMEFDGIQAIEKNGKYVVDEEGDYVTTLVSDGGRCAYVVFDNGIAACAIEKAHNAGVIDFKKPISCHLYPIRVQKLPEYDALNYHKWHICMPACECGANLDVPVYRFLKGPLIRKYGEAWYAELDEAATAWNEGRVEL